MFGHLKMRNMQDIANKNKIKHASFLIKFEKKKKKQ